MAILEPRISGENADRVIQKIGLVEGARVDACGFSGGIWCLWRSNFMPVSVIASSRYCIHLKINPNSPLFWYYSVVYASSNAANREEVWQELREFNISNPGPWCLASDFNSITSANERIGGAIFNYRSCSDFVD